MSDTLLILLKNKKIADAYQYYIACGYKLYYAECSYQALENVKPRAIKALSDLVANRKGVNGVQDDTVDFLGVPMDATHVVDMLTVDIFSLLHGFFDTFAQWMNAAMLGEKALEIRGVSLAKFGEELSKYPEYTGAFVRRLVALTKEPEYRYIADFNNILKHRGQIFVKNQCDVLSGRGDVSVPSFVKDKRVHAKEPLSDVLKKSLDYCRELFDESVDYIEQYYADYDNNYVSHRMYNPMTYVDNYEKPSECYYYIDVDPANIPDHTDIMLCERNTDVPKLYNSPYSIIVLREKGTKRKVGLLKPDDAEVVNIKDGHMLMYRKYNSITSGYEKEMEKATDGRSGFQVYYRFSEPSVD